MWVLWDPGYSGWVGCGPAVGMKAKAEVEVRVKLIVSITANVSAKVAV